VRDRLASEREKRLISALVHEQAIKPAVFRASEELADGAKAACKMWATASGSAMPYKFNESRRHKIPKAKYGVTNWPEYDAALIRRGSVTLWFSEEAIEAVPHSVS